MPTTPVEPGSLYRLHYTALGVQHVFNCRVDVRTPHVYGVKPDIAAFSGAGADRDSDDFGAYLWSKVSPVYQAADSFDTYEVFDVTTSPPTFIYGSTAGLPGTHGGATSRRAEHGTVLTFRDAHSKKVKFNWFATNDGSLYRHTSLGVAVMAVFATDLLPAAGAGSLNDYITGRSGNQIVQFMSECGGANNALERKILFG